MKSKKTSRTVKALGLCSGGLDSILSALILQRQEIDVTWICFITPFFSAGSAKKASLQTGTPLVIMDITEDYMEMMKSPKAGFGKHMNPCMDCHALMFAKAGQYLKTHGFDFLFSGEVSGQRPKSQNRNALRYVEKNSGFDGMILRPLCAKRLPETLVEKKGLVDREQLLDITGRSRKVQLALAEEFGVTDYPSPAGGCLLTDPLYSLRLKDLMCVQRNFDRHELYLLKYGRHFRLNEKTKVIVGRSKKDNMGLTQHMNPQKDILLKHARMPGPDVVLTGSKSNQFVETAAEICAAYTKSKKGDTALIKYILSKIEKKMNVVVKPSSAFKSFML